MLVEDDQAPSGTAGVEAALASCGEKQDVLWSGGTKQDFLTVADASGTSRYSKRSLMERYATKSLPGFTAGRQTSSDKKN